MPSKSAYYCVSINKVICKELQEKLWELTASDNAYSCRTLPWPIYICNSVVNTKLPATYININILITSVAAKFRVLLPWDCSKAMNEKILLSFMPSHRNI